MRCLAFSLVALSMLPLQCATKKLPPMFVDQSNQFGMELFYLINQPGKNVVIAPFSIDTILLMSLYGAAGSTEKNMRTSLGIRGSKQMIAKAFGEYISSFDSGMTFSSHYSFSFSNGLWLQYSFTPLKTFERTVYDNFGATIFQVDFTKPGSVIQKINAEVSKESKGTITEFVTEGEIDTSTRMLLTNFCYFQGEWKYPFSNARTRKALFYSYGKSSPEMTETMFGDLLLPYYEDAEVQCIALPIKGSSSQPSMELLVLLPRAKSNTAPFSFLYNGKGFKEISSQMKAEQVKISIPKFSFSVRIPLADSLQTLGMTLPFSSEADFSQITGKRNLFISRCFSETYFLINESGIVASSGSGASFDIKSGVLRNRPKAFEANRPFMYALFDKTSGLIHFLGEFDAPSFESFPTPRVTLEPQTPAPPPQLPSFEQNPNDLDSFQNDPSLGPP